MIEREPVIEVDNLTKRYGQLLAVDRVSFAVGKGEFFGFLGPNGAGKTTTVRMLTGVIRPDGGEARVTGHPAGSLAAKQASGVVPEMANVYGDLTAWGNLMLMADLYGIPRREAARRAISLLEELGLAERKDSPAKTFSKGMKQRLTIAMALLSDPEVLFLDEPTSGLDVQSARLIKALLCRLNEEGKTVFLTTHDMDEASDLCHRVAIINRGRLVAVDSPGRIRLAVEGMHSVEVSFDRTVPVEKLESLPDVTSVRQPGDRYRLYSPDPGAVVTALAGFACAEGLKIILLNTLAPSLEDAFVALTEEVKGCGA